jgi:hypothetical protein
MYCCFFAVVALISQPSFAQDDSAFVPSQESLPVAPPSDAIVLYDGKTNRFLSMSGTKVDWPEKEGSLVSTRNGDRANHIVSQWHFRDADIHVEFMVNPKASGNSGIYIHGNYEMQILDSEKESQLSEHTEGALYGFSKPLVNAALPAGQWQVYDIRYRAPRRNNEGEITEPGRITAWLNGKLVQKETEFGEPRSVYHPFRYGTTSYLEKIAKIQKQTQVGPVFLQDHDSPARFRNVWIRPLDNMAKEYIPE